MRMRSFHIALFAVSASLQSVITAPVWDEVQQVVSGEQASTGSRIRSALRKAEVIPNVLDDDFEPLISLNITYPKSGKAVELGNTITPKAVSSAPDLIAHPIDQGDTWPRSRPTKTIRSNATYTLVLTDPDATSRSDPAMAEMCHWIVTGLQFNASSEDQVMSLHADVTAILDNLRVREAIPEKTRHSSSVKELMSYYPPAPPPKTAYHRYVFVLLASKPVVEHVPEKPQKRAHWGYGKVGKGVRDWASDNGLTPVGANFFYAEDKTQ
ncbi:MAG: hypothetical protein Q9207_001317 [Kuettlingeria erythrocarpa]